MVVEPPEQYTANTEDISDENSHLTEPSVEIGEREDEASEEDEKFNNDVNLSLINLEETRNLFKSGQALKDFKQQLHNFLYPSSSIGETVHSTARLDSTPSVTFDVTKGRSFNLVADLLSTAAETITKVAKRRSKG